MRNDSEPEGRTPISNTTGDDVLHRTPLRSAPSRAARAAVSGAVLGNLVLLFFGVALVTAAPAAAVGDPSRPEARVTHGPSCRPGGLVVEVVAGTAPYFVRLATTRRPAGEDEATLAAGQRVDLHTGDVAWGETIDGRLEFTARDGSGVTYTDELDEYSFTRPTEEDCAAVGAPTDPEPTPGTTSAPAVSAAPTSSSAGSPSAPDQPNPTPTSAPPGAPGPAGPNPVGPHGGTTPRAVPAGGTVLLQAGGFRPGERVTIHLRGGGILGSATAGPDGTVRTQVRLPGRTATGPATVELVGNDSAVVAGIGLKVASARRDLSTGGADVLPLAAAAVALVLSVGGLVSVAGGRRGAASRRALNPSA